MKNVVLTLGFNGLEFKGSHYLDEAEGRTVERELEKALVGAGIIEGSKCHSEDMLQRASS